MKLSITKKQNIMKTIVLGLIFIGFTTLMQSQNEIASVNVNLNENVKPIKNVAINSDYYNAFDKKISSQHVRKFQNLVANYDIKQTKIYSPSQITNYTVVFKEGKNQINAEYNHQGNIVQCNEIFRDIKLPYAISSDVAKNYPGWKFCTITCEVLYDLESDQQVIYTVAIQNGNKKKSLELNAADYSL